MKMKKKALISSILTIALCFSLIAGSTFALFTSESQTNIAATSATVDVKAVVLENTLETYSFDVAQAPGMFELGGTATFDADSNLTLTNMVPGDKVIFDIQVTNNSNVDVKYRVKWVVDGVLAEALDATANGAAIVDNTSAWALWEIPATDADKVQDIEVIIELPAEVGNDYQDKAAEITFIVEAIQGNAEVVDVATVDDLKTAMANATAAGKELEVTLMNDITLTESLAVTTDTVIDANGKTITASTGSAEGSRVFNVNNDGFDVDFTLKNATVVNASGWTERFISYNDSGKLTVENVTINGGFNYAVNLPSSSNNADVLVKDCDITSSICVNAWGANSNIKVVNCNFSVRSTNEYTSVLQINYLAVGSTLEVVGGTYSAVANIGGVDEPSYVVFDAAGDAVITISPDAQIDGLVYSAANVALVAYPPSNYFYGFSTLQSAIDKVSEDNIGIVTLIADVDADVTVAAGESIIIDLNGFEYTGTITNNGTLVIRNAAGPLNVTGNVTYE